MCVCVCGSVFGGALVAFSVVVFLGGGVPKKRVTRDTLGINWVPIAIQRDPEHEGDQLLLRRFPGKFRSHIEMMPISLF